MRGKMSEADLRNWVGMMATRLQSTLAKQGVEISHEQAFNALRDTLTVGDVLTYISEQNAA